MRIKNLPVCRMVFIGTLFALLSCLHADNRPPFNKSSYKGTVWSHANPWFPPNKPGNGGDGGPDFAWHKYPEDPVLMWKKVAEICAPYGINGLQLEIIPRENGEAGYIKEFQEMLEGFRLAGNGFKAVAYFSPKKYNGKNNPEIIAKVFQNLLPLIKTHPNAYRLDGHPVIPVYQPHVFKPEEWNSIIREVEKNCGRMIWLADIRNTFVRNDAPEGFTQWLRNYMKTFDGITIYANWTLEQQRAFVDNVVPVMKKEFPEKIFESGPHNTYCNHFSFEGISPRLTEKFIKSWDMTLEAWPDSITITNFFDIFECSRVLPSYEMDDILMKISEYYISIWRGQDPPDTQTPSLYVANYISTIIGNDARFEIIGFPLKAANKKVYVQLEISDARGKILYTFPAEEMLLDSMRVLKYHLPTLEFAGTRELYPKLKYIFEQKEFTATSYPPTTLVTSLRPYLLMWCRSLKNMIDMNEGNNDWTINGVHPGDTAPYPPGGTVVINSNAGSRGTLPNQCGKYVRILRNGKEIESFKQGHMKFNRVFKLPDPGDSIDSYNLEQESDNGCRYISPSIWVSKNTRPSKCRLPVLLPDNTITDTEIEDARIPFFYYPCTQDHGGLLLDYSGYDHHGILGAGASVWQRHLQRTGYHHEHLDYTKPELPKDAPAFRKDQDGNAFLHFSGNNCAVIMGGTAFPYAFTYEINIRTNAAGEKLGIIGTPNGQMNLEVSSDGTLCAWRISSVGEFPDDKKIRSEIISKEKLAPGKWYDVAVVYDLKKLSLYIDGKLQGVTSSIPDRKHEWKNMVTIGSLCKAPWDPETFFKGDIRDIRIYGRNLKPEEFLRH